MTKRELEHLKQEFEQGKYVKKSTLVLTVALTLALGLFLGNLLTVIYSGQSAGLQAAPVKKAQQQPQPSPMEQAQVSQILEMERLTRSEPWNVGAWRKLGNAYYDTNRPANAIAAYTKCLELDSTDPNVWTDLGTMYRRNSQFEKAIDCYNEAIMLNPSHQNALFNKGVIYMHDLQNKTKAIESWEMLLASNPSATTPQGKPLKEYIDAHR